MLGQNTYTGQNTSIELNDDRVMNLVSFEIEHTVNFEVTKGIETLQLQSVTESETAKATGEVYVSAEWNMHTLKGNTPITNIAYDSLVATEGSQCPASFWASFPPATWRIGTVVQSARSGRATLKFEMTPNHLDNPVVAP